MRRVLVVLGLVTLGLLLGFAGRLLWPRSTAFVYARPTIDDLSAEHRSE